MFYKPLTGNSNVHYEKGLGLLASPEGSNRKNIDQVAEIINKTEIKISIKALEGPVLGSGTKSNNKDIYVGT